MTDQTTSRSTRPIDAGHLAGLLGRWADGAHGTLAQQLATAVRGAIAAGLLVDGSRLPAERALASALSVSRATVTSALDQLRSEGLLVSRQGSGTVVRARPAGAVVGTRIAEHFGPTGAIDLAAGNPPDAGHLPPIKVDVAALLAAGEGPGVQPLGLPSLREALAEQHSRHGRLTDVGEIHVTSGAHHAIALAVDALAGPGDAVAVEAPSYPGIFDIVDQLGAVAIPVRGDHHGVIPDDLDRVLAEHRPPVLYLQSGPHNPTGRVSSATRRREVAEVLDRHATTVIEDTALADLTFAGRLRPELADLCRRATVVTVGSFSKVAWGGLRVGWLRAPAPFVERTKYLRLNHDLGTSVPSQLLALQLLPHMEELAEERRTQLSEATQRAADRLAETLPEWTLRLPLGGSVLWPVLPVPDATSFVRLAGRHGVHVAPGSIAVPGRAADPHLRICVDRPWPSVEAGLDRLGRAWRDLTSAPGHVFG